MSQAHGRARGLAVVALALGLASGAWSLTLPAARASEAVAAPAAAQEQGFNKAEVSLWLRPVARRLGLSTDALWTAVIWLNFAILIYFLYFLLYRMRGFSLPGLMQNRSRTIRKKLAEAEEAYREAAERLRSIEARLRDAPAEIAALEAQAAREAEAEYQRVLADAAMEAEKVARSSEQRMETAVKVARQELREYAGELAVAIAEQRLRRRVDAELDRQVVRQSLARLRPANGVERRN